MNPTQKLKNILYLIYRSHKTYILRLTSEKGLFLIVNHYCEMIQCGKYQFPIFMMANKNNDLRGHFKIGCSVRNVF